MPVRPRVVRLTALTLAGLAAAVLAATIVVWCWLWLDEAVASLPEVLFFGLLAVVPASGGALLGTAAGAVWRGRRWGLSLSAGVCVLVVIGAIFLSADFVYRSIVGLTVDAASWWLLAVLLAVIVFAVAAAVLLRRLRHTLFVVETERRGRPTGANR
ncbi:MULTISPECIES: hypothetical protein [Actinoalloteichus]|uniref:Uncharacterized protein n=1 Tax=Actinoalloteichus fjordicus TaxID=1612552 RepID=A0AAC9L9R9_9PSEU|nr:MULTISPECIES: hypothetical protein [Actinoalloteichus]APU12404.1 hypothetical protein UA74_01580 [Actinoalloteichus fjordicus]APU18357.1 hypothetical protein UA75_01585 [Actinoalloteichus sp. GBA129-24]